jgi:ureidoacrylate peracid hydrolase
MIRRGSCRYLSAVEKNYPMFSKPMTHDEFLSGLKSGKAVETKSRGYEAA